MDLLVELCARYWLFLVLALAIGAVAGWLAANEKPV